MRRAEREEEGQNFWEIILKALEDAKMLVESLNSEKNGIFSSIFNGIKEILGFFQKISEHFASKSHGSKSDKQWNSMKQEMIDLHNPVADQMNAEIDLIENAEKTVTKLGEAKKIFITLYDLYRNKTDETFAKELHEKLEALNVEHGIGVGKEGLRK